MKMYRNDSQQPLGNAGDPPGWGRAGKWVKLRFICDVMLHNLGPWNMVCGLVLYFFSLNVL